jgi:hypothetical protein
MNTQTAQNKATWSGPSLAIAIAAACAAMASSSERPEALASVNPPQLVQASSASIESLIDRAVSVLQGLETSMAMHTKALCQDEPPKEHLDDQPFGLIANNLRFVEKQLRDLGVPMGGEAEYIKLTRALAKARSVAVLNDSLIRQWTTIPQTFESDIDLEGLRALAELTTRRLGERVG